MLVVLAAVVVSQCTSDSSWHVGHQGFVNGALPAGYYTRVMGLGRAERIEMTCLRMTESPVGGVCAEPSVMQLCRGDVEPASCQSLAVFRDDYETKLTRGGNGVAYDWILAFDGRGKNASCYPREITVNLLRELTNDDDASSSTAVSVIAIVLVCLIVLLIAIIFGVYLHHKSLREKSDLVHATPGPADHDIIA